MFSVGTIGLLVPENRGIDIYRHQNHVSMWPRSKVMSTNGRFTEVPWENLAPFSFP